jgi:hypothetical protein
MLRFALLTLPIVLVLCAPPSFAVETKVGGKAGLTYRNNLYRESTHTTSDGFFTLAPDVTLKSDNSSVTAALEGGYYLSHTDNNYVDGTLQGSHAFNDNAELYGLWKRDHVDVGGFSSDVTDLTRRSKTPTIFMYGEVGAHFSTLLTKQWESETDLKAAYYNYQNTNSIQNRRIIQDDRDRYELMGTTQLGYRLSPTFLPFLTLDVNRRLYREQVDATIRYGKDSFGGGLYAGAEFGKKEESTLWGKGRVGWLTQRYENDFLPDVDTVGVDLDATLRLAEDTILQGVITRNVGENSTFGASGTLQTIASLTLTHPLAQAWKGDVGGRYTEYDFLFNPQAGRGTRRDHLYEATTGLTYAWEKPYFFRTAYSFATRDSNLPQAAFDDHLVMLSVGLKY